MSSITEREREREAERENIMCFDCTHTRTALALLSNERLNFQKKEKRTLNNNQQRVYTVSTVHTRSNTQE